MTIIIIIDTNETRSHLCESYSHSRMAFMELGNGTKHTSVYSVAAEASTLFL